MELTAYEDIEASQEAVFRAVSDFDAFERAVLRRGAELRRIDDLKDAGEGMKWEVDFVFRGRWRKAEVEIVELLHPDRMVAKGCSGGVKVDFIVELVALSRGRTRMSVRADIRATSLPARLLLKPMKLAQSNILKRFRKKVALFAGKVEDDDRTAGRV